MFRLRRWIPLAASGIALWLGAGSAWAEGDAKRGAYIYTAAGCQGCHTAPADAKKKVYLAGGRGLKTPFGTYYSPNITPDKETGIGKWSEADFKRALRDGKRPDGANYFPVFPYPAYTKMTDGDIADLWAHMKSLAPVKRANREHEVGFPFSLRLAVGVWRIMHFKSGPMAPDPSRSEGWNRGAYLSEALSHCGECHTSRDMLGGLKLDMHMAGAIDGPGGEPVPNITPDKETGIGNWSTDDYESLLSLGMLPDGDFIGGEMTEVYENISKLTSDDLKAMIEYLMALPPIRNKVSKHSH